MRNALLILLIGTFQVLATGSYSQTTQLNLEMKGATVKQVLSKIEDESEFYFLYNSELVDVEKRVDISIKNKKLGDVLTQLFDSNEVDFLFKDRHVVITPKDESVTQQTSISGTVTDEAGEPLPGVTVLIKGTTQGTVTDMNGKYSISDLPGDATLQFSFVGMLSQEVEVGTQTTIDVTMNPDAIGIEEVVAIGYGTMRKSDLTGSLVSVRSDNFDKQPITRIDQALQGRAAGVQVSQVSGAPGAALKVRIRGTNSINGLNEPLYIVDGLSVSNINAINVSDIQSMEVLKDASSTAIYGSRGANGVVVITTKNGRKNDMKIDVESSYGISNVPSFLPIMEAADFAEGVNFWDKKETFSSSEISALKTSGGEDWQDAAFQSAATSNTQVSVSGGGKSVDYFVSAGYLNQEGILIGEDYTRYSFRAKLNADLTSKTKFGINAYHSRAENTGVSPELSTVVIFDPTTPVFDSNGEYTLDSEKAVATDAFNPLFVAAEKTRENYKDQFIANAYLDFKITPDLVFNTSVGVEQLFTSLNSYTPIFFANGKAEVTSIKMSVFQNTNRLTYTKKISEHSIKVDAIHEQVYSRNSGHALVGTGFVTDNTTYKALQMASLQNIRSYNGNGPLNYDRSLQSFVGRINYSYASKYLLSASVRADGSSVFQKDKWGIFPSVSAAWRLSEEGFIQDVHFISNLKLRGSYGITGSQAISPLDTRSIPEVGGKFHDYTYDGSVETIGIAPPSRLANPDLTWEETAQLNAGFDIGLTDSRINLSFDWYKKNTTGLLLDVALPAHVGANVITQNIGEVQNQGFDVSLGFVAVDSKDWKINSSLSLSSNANKIVALSDDKPIEGTGKIYLSEYPTRLEVGMPISSFRGYKFIGVWKEGEKAGQAKYEDISEDGIITTDDVANIGDGNPDIVWGLNTNAEYKGFELNVFLQGMHGNDVYNFTRARMMGLGPLTYHPVHADFADRWSTSNSSSNIPSLRENAQVLSSQFLEDGSFVRIKNVSLSYTFKDIELLNKLGVSSLRMFASGENLLTITNYTGYDPEVSASGNSDLDVGIDYDAYPIPRTFTIGLNVSF